jgi:ectoine hydroxylase-related dioxygenase (phytanoyl-CoA dioxygenase family)
VNQLPEPLSYGIAEARLPADQVEVHLEEIEVRGYTIVPSGLDAAALDDLRRRLDVLHGEDLAEGSENFPADRDLIRCPLARDDAFLGAATLPAVVAIAERALGESIVLLQQNAILNQPVSEQFQSRWHRDLPYQHFVTSRRLAVNALLCVDDFTGESGGTVVLPGSHMFEGFPSAGLVAKEERVAEAPAGSVIMMDALLFHRAGANITQGVRRGINHLIGRPFLAQQIDIPRQLNGRHAEDPFLARYLGYRWNPAVDVQTWRNARA